MGGRYTYLVTGSGSITIGGSAFIACSNWNYIEPGSLEYSYDYSVDYTSAFADPDAIFLNGSALCSVNPRAYLGSGDITIGGSASVLFNSGDFYYYGSGDIYINGSAKISKYYVHGGGAVYITGSAHASSGWLGNFAVSAGSRMALEYIEYIPYIDVSEPTFTGLTNRISVLCSQCISMPLSLQMIHNIGDANLLSQFLVRNNFTLPATITMYYNQPNQSWQANYYYSGIALDNSNSTETWNIVIEWACTNDIAATNLGDYVWEFSLLFIRKNLSTGYTADTRVMAVFPSDQICSGQTIFDFSFEINIQNLFVSTNTDILSYVYLLTDNIGLFNSNYWFSNPTLDIEIREANNSNTTERQNIAPILSQ